MVGLASERILVIGDPDRQIAAALSQALPGAQITAAANYFDAMAELTPGRFTAVLAAVEPIERRPEAAVRALRELAGDGRVLLFGLPAHEPISRRMLEFGCDDYVLTPCAAAELQQLFGSPPPLRLSPAGANTDNGQPPEPDQAAAAKIASICGPALSEIVLDALANQPHDARRAAIDQINRRLAPAMRLYLVPAGRPEPIPPAGMSALAHAVRAEGAVAGNLLLMMPEAHDAAPVRHVLAELAHMVGRLGLLEERHNRLQRLAIVDDLTGVYNGRYFKHFLTKICERALEKQFSVTLLLFDIDDFKRYNDQYGHGLGDEILRQTAALMRRCCREHDLVARVSGDEFAVVFWDKEGPRIPRDALKPPDANTPAPVILPSRPPQHPWQVFKRFRQLIASTEFALLGSSGKGTLTISGGMAAFPWETRDPEKLIELADRRLMFGAKKCGKDTLVLVGEEDCLEPENDGNGKGT